MVQYDRVIMKSYAHVFITRGKLEYLVILIMLISITKSSKLCWCIYCFN